MSPSWRRRPAPVRIPAPAVYSQEELRARRRQRLSVVYGSSFDLATEMAAICAPLAVGVAATPNPAAFAAEVEVVVAAGHEVVSTVVGMLAPFRATSLPTMSRPAPAPRRATRSSPSRCGRTTSAT